MGIRHMQGVPAHLETLHSDDGVRRHPAHCMFAEGKGRSRICGNPHCEYYLLPCHSAKRCDYYEDKRLSGKE